MIKSPKLFLLLMVLFCACLVAQAQPSKSTVDFNHDIRPILSENCFKCHGPDDGARKAKMRLDIRAEALKPAKSGELPIVPGAPEKSELIKRVTAADLDDRMPPAKTGRTLSSGQINLLKSWIAQGAPYATHWAYVKPARPPLPQVTDKRWPKNSLDFFILSRLEREKLRPSPAADRYTLIRRVSLDLTGLPPTPEEVDRFLNDHNARSYENLIDRLLAKPAFGEHWARFWLDLARYADSAGYADDPLRTIWSYRDYVIRSFNANKPFDRFTIEQIAGDLLDNPDDEDLIATAFHRNTMTNNEGGTQDEEFRNAAVIDRVNTTMAVWMATSMGCAQCHNHKYDPISQQEYFRMFAFLNNTEDADRQDEAPVLDLSSKEQKEKRAGIETDLAAAEKAVKEAAPDSPDLEAQKKQVAELKKTLAATRPVTVPIMRELPPDKRRKTHIELRGNYLALADEVTEGVPAAFHPLPSGAPLNRLTLARWLMDENNPLTARVIANRFWEQIFGTGIVRTSEDFGTQGEPPSHPELLDWLATELVAHKWDVKGFLKLLVTSAAYEQSSRVTPELQERDPDNRLLARGPRFRMPAEVIRDQALAVSGLLSSKMFGPPVRPPQPSSGLAAAFGSSLDWKTSEGEDRYRRAIYTEWRRTSPYPSMATFDAPNREVCALRRARSNTPLQALVTLNDPVFFEAAQALGNRMADSAGTTADKIAFGFKLCITRPPRPHESQRLVQFFESARSDYEKKLPKTQQMKVSFKPSKPGQSKATAAESAAWSALGNVLLNLDETLMRP